MYHLVMNISHVGNASITVLSVADVSQYLEYRDDTDPVY